MSSIDANSSGGRSQRLWIVETLVVLGIVAFGYFALTMDSQRWTGAPAETAPIANLVR